MPGLLHLHRRQHSSNSVGRHLDVDVDYAIPIAMPNRSRVANSINPALSMVTSIPSALISPQLPDQRINPALAPRAATGVLLAPVA